MASAKSHLVDDEKIDETGQNQRSRFDTLDRCADVAAEMRRHARLVEVDDIASPTRYYQCLPPIRMFVYGGKSAVGRLEVACPTRTVLRTETNHEPFAREQSAGRPKRQRHWPRSWQPRHDFPTHRHSSSINQDAACHPGAFARLPQAGGPSCRRALSHAHFEPCLVARSSQPPNVKPCLQSPRRRKS